MLHSQEVREELESDEEEPETNVPAHKRKRRTIRELPADLVRCDVFHAQSDEQKQCACGNVMLSIDEEDLEQLAIVHQQVYVIVHHRL